MSDEPSLPPSELLDASPPLLGPTQRRIAGFSLTLLAVFGSIALVVGALIVIGQSISYFSSVLWPLATAGVMALILRPVVEWVEAHRLSGVFRLLSLELVPREAAGPRFAGEKTDVY